MDQEQWDWLSNAVISIQDQLMELKRALTERPPPSEDEDSDLPPLRPDKAKGDGYWIVSQQCPGHCRKCEARIYWHISRKKKKCAIDPCGRFHFDICKGSTHEAAPGVPKRDVTYEPPPAVLDSEVPF